MEELFGTTRPLQYNLQLPTYFPVEQTILLRSLGENIEQINGQKNQNRERKVDRLDAPKECQIYFKDEA